MRNPEAQTVNGPPNSSSTVNTGGFASALTPIFTCCYSQAASQSHGQVQETHWHTWYCCCCCCSCLLHLPSVLFTRLCASVLLFLPQHSTACTPVITHKPFCAATVPTGPAQGARSRTHARRAHTAAHTRPSFRNLKTQDQQKYNES